MKKSCHSNSHDLWTETMIKGKYSLKIFFDCLFSKFYFAFCSFKNAWKLEKWFCFGRNKWNLTTCFQCTKLYFMKHVTRNYFSLLSCTFYNRRIFENQKYRRYDFGGVWIEFSSEFLLFRSLFIKPSETNLRV